MQKQKPIGHRTKSCELLALMKPDELRNPRRKWSSTEYDFRFSTRTRGLACKEIQSCLHSTDTAQDKGDRVRYCLLLASSADPKSHVQVGKEGCDHNQRHKAELARDFELHCHLQSIPKLTFLVRWKANRNNPCQLQPATTKGSILNGERTTSSANRRSGTKGSPKRPKN